MTPPLNVAEHDRSAEGTPVPEGELCSLTSRSGELAHCWTFADEHWLDEVVAEHSSPPQVSVDQCNGAEHTA